MSGRPVSRSQYILPKKTDIHLTSTSSGTQAQTLGSPSSPYSYVKDHFPPPLTAAQILKTPAPQKPVGPTPTQNRFTPLVPPSQTKSSWLKKSEYIKVLPIETEWKNIPIANLASTILPPDFHFVPTASQKTRTFYEFILIDTESIELTHNMHNNQISHSKFKILKVLSLSDWNQPIYQHKPFSQEFTPQTYNYLDYQQAWYNFLFYKPNETFSWFVWFAKGISLKFPRWFVNWFYSVGPIPDYFPEAVDPCYEHFRMQTNFPSGFRFLSFLASFGIPWIMKWEYASHRICEDSSLTFLIRDVYVKWWPKYNMANIQPNRINEWVAQFKNKNKVATPSASQTSTAEPVFLSEKSRIMALLAKVTTEEEFENCLDQLRSPSPSIKNEEEGPSTSKTQDDQNEDDCYLIFDELI